MPEDILLISGSLKLAENIRQEVEETDDYCLHVASNKSSAIVKADEVGASIAMLDYSKNEDWLCDIGIALRTIHPNIALIILCDDESNLPLFESLRPWSSVRKPLSWSSFMNAINKPLSKKTKKTDDSPTPWLADPNKAAQYLTRITLESSAQAALITRNDKLWAYAGGLSQKAATEVAQAVTRNKDEHKGSDLLRFIRLESTKAEHMLYAANLTRDAVLALVFDAETPFSTIRSQAGQLVTAMDDEPEAETNNEVKENFTSPKKNIPLDLTQPKINPVNHPKINDEGVRKQEPSHFPRKWEKSSATTNDNRFLTSSTNLSNPKNEFPGIKNKLPEIPQPANPSQPRQKFSEGKDENFSASILRKQENFDIKPDPIENDLTQVSPTTEAERKLSMEPVSAGLYHLTYTCLLLPRFSSQYLTGDISEKLNEWLPVICVAYGWRLEYLSVRPEYLQWAVNVQPNTSPGYLMRIMREQTSEKLLSEFPYLEKENPSGDFWAPGYLIMGGSQPHPQQLIRDYIKQTRQRQGQQASTSPGKPRDPQSR